MRTLLLAGGGHTHALYLLNARQLLPEDIRVVLISPERFVTCSAMLPGLVAGHYRFRDGHIDLGQLCRTTETELVFGRIARLDLEGRRAILDDERELPFDLVSLNTGLQADEQVPGTREHALSTRPISRFLPRWQGVLERLYTRARNDRANLGVIGGDAAAVEMALAVRQRLNRDERLKTPLTLHLIHSGRSLLPAFPPAAQLQAARMLQACQIRVQPLLQITRVEAGQVLTERRQQLSVDEVIWCLPGVASRWPAESGLAVDARGRVQVNRELRSVSHPFVFAAGEIASITEGPPSRANALAERQARVLAANIVRSFSGEPLRPFKPPKYSLDILACGDDFALARWGNRVWSGRWVWRWKRRNNRKYMAQFPRA